ncbi:MAG TPA: hypothetical protein VKC60_11790 [Opitutaceae bacterium]|nr:hypothetical protein [Opitutaceae bacterium]
MEFSIRLCTTGSLKALVASSAKPLEFGAGVLHCKEDTIGVKQELPTGVCEAHLASKPFEKTAIELFFQRSDRVADRRLGQKEFSGC